MGQQTCYVRTAMYVYFDGSVEGDGPLAVK